MINLGDLIVGSIFLLVTMVVVFWSLTNPRPRPRVVPIEEMRRDHQELVKRVDRLEDAWAGMVASRVVWRDSDGMPIVPGPVQPDVLPSQE